MLPLCGGALLLITHHPQMSRQSRFKENDTEIQVILVETELSVVK